ncbi:MAG: acyltransferase family protein [Duncaniella sp.]|nr:acyltransferase family protein [Duncaniella sp.]HBI58825.1 hypothetical protein [Porphyromonadaceae bacterium]
MDQTTSRVLALIRWPLIMCIVAVHVFSTDTLQVSGGIVRLEDYGLFRGLWHWVKGFLSENGVATFFFISGYLFFSGGEMTKARYLSKVKRRFHSLFVPYVVWNTIAIAFVCGIEYVATRGVSAGGRDVVSGYLMNSFAGYPHDAPMWFIRELMLCVLLVPFFNYVIVRRGGWFIVVLLGAVCFYLYTRESDYMLLLFSSLFFFYFGGLLSIRNINLLDFFGKWRVQCFILYPVLGLAYMVVSSWSYEAAMLIKCCNMLVVIALAINLAAYLVEKYDFRANKFLTGAAFFVFASHYIALYHFKVVLMKVFHPATGLGVVATFITGYFLLLGCLLGLYYLITAFMPRAAGLLTGRRAA